jgi:hypothetical protein
MLVQAGGHDVLSTVEGLMFDSPDFARRYFDSGQTHTGPTPDELEGIGDVARIYRPSPGDNSFQVDFVRCSASATILISSKSVTEEQLLRYARALDTRIGAVACDPEALATVIVTANDRLAATGTALEPQATASAPTSP